MNESNRPHSLQSTPPSVPEIESLLETLALEKPGAEFYQRLSNQPWIKKGKSTIQTVTGRSRVVSVLATSALALFIMTLTLMATPSGQTLAQSLLRFFIPVENSSFPLPTTQFELSNPQPTLVSTFAVSPVKSVPHEGFEATTPVLPTAIPVLENCAATNDYPCHVRNAEATLSFDIKEPPNEIEGFNYSNLIVIPETQTVQFEYNGKWGGMFLYITQTRGDLTDSAWSETPPDNIVAVKVNGYDGEYVQGYFVSIDSTSATWNADAPFHRLRWRDNDMLFEIAWMGEVGPIENVNAENLIAIAESMK